METGQCLLLYFFIHSFTYIFSPYLLSNYYVPEVGKTQVDRQPAIPEASLIGEGWAR